MSCIVSRAHSGLVSARCKDLRKKSTDSVVLLGGKVNSRLHSRLAKRHSSSQISSSLMDPKRSLQPATKSLRCPSLTNLTGRSFPIASRHGFPSGSLLVGITGVAAAAFILLCREVLLVASFFLLLLAELELLLVACFWSCFLLLLLASLASLACLLASCGCRVVIRFLYIFGAKHESESGEFCDSAGTARACQAE